ncbi:MAG: hypothetical protein LKJ44_01945 [Bifidobacteriaceae bacterium]|nr:hypothetical protein [Bifidobacteriaceae bacterium]MCI1978469.1 hypothetical protein [Bifidobacteriaceae bacterium]
MYSHEELAYRRKKIFELDNGSLWDSCWSAAVIATIPFGLASAGFAGWQYGSFWAFLEWLVVVAVGAGAIHTLERLYVLYSRKDLRLYRGLPIFNTLPAWLLGLPVVLTGNMYLLNRIYGLHDLAGPMTLVGIGLFILSIPFDLFILEKIRLKKYLEKERANQQKPKASGTVTTE